MNYAIAVVLVVVSLLALGLFLYKRALTVEIREFVDSYPPRFVEPGNNAVVMSHSRTIRIRAFRKQVTTEHVMVVDAKWRELTPAGLNRAIVYSMPGYAVQSYTPLYGSDDIRSTTVVHA